MGIAPGATYAQEVVVHAREAIPVPEHLSDVEAACIPEAFLTAYDALFQQLQINIGSRVLIHAIGSGVGNAALQLAKATGATVIATSRTQSKLLKFNKLVPTSSSSPGAKRWNNLRIFKAAQFCKPYCRSVGASYFDQNLRSLLTRSCYRWTLGGRACNANLGLILRKRIVMGTVLRMRPIEEKISLAQSFPLRCPSPIRSKKAHPRTGLCFPWSRPHKPINTWKLMQLRQIVLVW